MSSFAEVNLKQARPIAVDTQTRIATNVSETGAVITNPLYRFRLNQRSSVNLQIKGGNAGVELLQDKNRNGRVDRNEIIKRTASRNGAVQTANAAAGGLKQNLNQGTYFVRILGNSDSSQNYRLALSAVPMQSGGRSSQSAPWSATRSQTRSRQTESTPYRLQKNEAGQLFVKPDPTTRSLSRNSKNRFRSVQASPDRWNASFINRSRFNVANYRSYNFDRPDFSTDLGSQGKSGTVIARLRQDYGMGSPNSKIRTRNFAMQAWTRVQLEEGKFYRITSQSDDGTRFLFKQPGSNRTVTEISGDWRNRTTKNGPWSQMLVAGQGGSLDFYVQYYERNGASTINVTLEQVQMTSRVTSGSAINLRSQPSTVSNTPIGSLSSGTSFSVVRQVRSANDSSYPNWYEITTSDGKRGFVAADSSLVELVGSSDLATIGTGTTPTNNPTVPAPSPQPNPQPQPPLGGTGGTDRKTFSFSTTYAKNNSYFTQDLAEITNPRYTSNSYRPIIEELALRYDWLQPSVIAAIGSRESAWGLLLSPRGPSGTGDNGYGRGIMQIDAEFHPEFISTGKWRDPKENLTYGIEKVLAPYYQYLDRNTNLEGRELLRAALASYNAGPGNVMAAYEAGLDVDYYTTGRDYGRDVLDRAGWFQLQGWV
ncbi:SH3 domain-containing protein [Leptolyngbya ohadii]|uniref:SH3 domain-containing protein n=1 Tax=Leptolyngbya ohadii TaxID=1962290 RepID=UPI00117BAAB3|nr:SH3 domain-containing protein [Leptolyngbya ohadii]